MSTAYPGAPAPVVDPAHHPAGYVAPVAARPLVARHISWGAIAAGVLIAIAIQLAFALLGLGVGLGVVEVGSDGGASGKGFAIGAGLWSVVSYLSATFVGAYVAAWMSGYRLNADGVLHGIVVWAVGLVLGLWLLGSAIGSISGGMFRAVSGVAQGTAEIAAAAPGVARSAGYDPQQVRGEIEQLLGTPPEGAPFGTPDRGQALEQIANDAPAAIQGDATAKNRIIDVIAQQQQIPRAEAEARYAQLEQRAQQAGQAIVQGAETARKGISIGALLAFGAVVAGAGLAAWGGGLGSNNRRREELDPDQTRVRA